MFIVDDSLFSRTSCKKTELGSKVFDHTDMHFKKGFRMLTLSWSEYYGAAEPPVRCGVSHLSGLTEPPIVSYSA